MIRVTVRTALHWKLGYVRACICSPASKTATTLALAIGKKRIDGVPRGYVFDKYYICMTNHTPESRKNLVTPTRGKVSTLSNFKGVYPKVSLA
jgi:hypothetical protein